MLFSIKNSSNVSIDIAKAKITNTAIRNILTYPMKATELRLNEELIATYKKPLKQICLELIAKANIESVNNEINILFIDKKFDNLASFITYGNLDLQGSRILRRAFKQIL